MSTFFFYDSHSKKFGTMGGLDLDFVVKKLNEFSPESISESWDNVGLLVEPYTKMWVWFIKKNVLLNVKEIDNRKTNL